MNVHTNNNEPEARELFLTLTNDGRFYQRRVSPYLDLLARHAVSEAGYNTEQAVKGYRTLVDDYAKHHYDLSSDTAIWYSVFSTDARAAVARALADDYTEDVLERAAALVTSTDTYHKGINNPSLHVRNLTPNRNGNTIGHYYVNGLQVTSRRIETGYNARLDSAAVALSKAGYDPAWYYPRPNEYQTGEDSSSTFHSHLFARAPIRVGTQVILCDDSKVSYVSETEATEAVTFITRRYVKQAFDAFGYTPPAAK